MQRCGLVTLAVPMVLQNAPQLRPLSRFRPPPVGKKATRRRSHAPIGWIGNGSPTRKMLPNFIDDAGDAILGASGLSLAIQVEARLRRALALFTFTCL